MSTLLQSIEKFIDNITVTDRQEESINTSFNNLKENLLKKDNGLAVKDVFLNGSYERDTIIRPLGDIDLFAVIDHTDYTESGQDPKPQTVLTKFKNYLNDIKDYKDKVKQDRPCVTVVLSDKDFDVLPALRKNGFLYIPNCELSGWTITDPITHTQNLNDVHRKRNYKVKGIVKAVKQWKRDNGLSIPSFHIEEIAIETFNALDFSNSEEGIRLWFTYAPYFLKSERFKSDNEYTKIQGAIQIVKDKLIEAKKLNDEKKAGEAKKIWKEIFGKEFPTLDDDEARSFSSSLSKGTLKYSTAAGLSTSVGTSMASSGGFYGSAQ